MAAPFSFLNLSVLVAFVLLCAVLNSARPDGLVTQGLSVAARSGGCCTSQDLPNPLATVYPNNATGVLNATLMIVPISLSTARRLIPSEYGILEHAYRALMPGFPQGMYPVLVQAAHDHDIQLRALDIRIDDFSRVGFEFPFLDLLKDGYSSFRWAPAQLISSDNDIALDGSRAYGTQVTPSRFQPPCDAFERLPSRHAGGMPPVYYFRGEGVAAPEQADEAGGSRPFLEVEFAPAVADGRTGPSSPYSLEVFRNITNQPIFANASTCDNMIRVFDSDLSAGPEHAPAVVRGRVRASQVAPWQGMAQADGEVVGDGEEEAGSLGEWEWTGVYGVQVATPFIENGYLECRSLQGYTGEGGPGARLRKASGSHDEI